MKKQYLLKLNKGILSRSLSFWRNNPEACRFENRVAQKNAKIKKERRLYAEIDGKKNKNRNL